MKNVFDSRVADEIAARIEKLQPETKALWGKMNAAQMLAHCNVTYEMVYTQKHPKPNAIMRFILKMLVKESVVNDKPYPKNGRTAPAFLVEEDQDFHAEKQRLVEHIQKTQQLGEAYFDNKESLSFGTLTSKEWQNLFYKHLDHHLRQFGV